MEWKAVKLQDVCIRITDGSHFSPQAQTEGYPMFSVKDMLEYGFDYSHCKRISKADFDGMVQNDCVPQKGDVLVAKDGSFLKSIFLCKETKEEAILSSIAIFRPDDKKILPAFLCYLLKSPSVYNYIASNCVSGSALPRIVLKDFKQVDLSIPDIETQRRIAAILSSLDDKIENNNRINANLEAQAQALFKSWFVDFEPGGGTMPEDWKEDSLTNIADFLNGLAMQKFPAKDIENSLPVLKIKELGQKHCDESSDRCTKEIKPEYIIHDGDVIFSWSGTLLVDIWCGGDCGLNQHLFKVSSNKYPKWFYYLWTIQHLQNFKRIASDKAVTMGHIKRGDLDKSIVLIPNDNVLEKMTAIMTPLLDSIVSNAQESQCLATLRDTLLPKLMRGEITL